MKEWKYLIGSADDFIGAPEWATEAVQSGDETLFSENHKGSQIAGERLRWKSSHADQLLSSEDANEYPHFFKIIAQRTESFGNAIDLEFCKANPDHPDCKCKSINFTIHNKSSEPVNIVSLITERGNKYGAFKDGAEIMRDLKNAMHSTDGWEKLSPSQQEALDMIQHKIGRVLNGDPNYDDSWKDIAGYATLIAEELSGNIK